MNDIYLTVIATLGASCLAVYLTYNTGQARIKNKIAPYIPSDNLEVLRANRAHMNILESMVAYLPVLWIASIYSYTYLAGIVGIVWLISRIFYSYVYLSAQPDKRMIPFLISLICFVITLLIAIVGITF